jgi:iron complex outermembrane receptor protein
VVRVICILNYSKINKSLIILISLLSGLFVYAENLELAPIIVKGEINDSTYTVHDFIGSHNSIELNQLQFLEVEDVLNQQAGIDIQSVSGIGQYATPIIRGAEGQQVLVFNNGIPLNSLNGSGADIGSISLIGIQSIEIFRGMVPMELSPTAIGGAINLKSENTNTNEGFAGFTLGSYGLKQAFLSQNLSTEKLNINFNFDQLEADNDFIYEENQSISSPSALVDEPRNNNGSEKQQISSLFSYDFSNNHKVSGYFNLEENKREISDVYNSQDNNSSITTDTTSFTFKHNFKIERSSNLETSYSYSESSQLYDDRESKIGLSDQFNQYDSKFNKLNITYKKRVNSLNFILNQQAQHEVLKSYFLNDPSSSTDQCLDTGIAGQCDGRYNRVQISSGARTEWQVTPQLYTNTQIVHLINRDDAFSSDSEDSDKSYTSLITGASYMLTDSIIFTSNLSRQVRPPSTSELYGDRGTTVGNEDLVSEKSQAVELGLKFPSLAYDFSIYYFFRRVEDNISAQHHSAGIIKYSNIAQTHYEGVDLSLTWDISPNLYFIGNATYQNGVIDDHIYPALIKNEIGDHRSLFINSSITYSPSWWSFNMEHILEDGGYYDDLNTLPRKRNSFWSAHISAKFNKTSISFSSINLTNQRVEDFPGTPVSGRTFFFKLKQNWSI